MAFFDQVYQKLFPSKGQKHKSLVHEIIDRSDRYTKEYEVWKNSIQRKELVKTVGNSYHMKEKGFVGSPDVHLLDSKYSNGFAISFDDTLNKKEFQFLFDWFAEKVQELGYKKSTSDLLVSDKGKHVESKEKHYLKPEIKDITPIDQKFGNILIEYILIDGKPSYLKLVANVYSDRMYQKPEQFEKLAEYLFDS